MNLIGWRASKVAMAGRYKLIVDMNSEHGNFTAASLKKYSAENITLKDFYLQGAHRKDYLILKSKFNTYSIRRQVTVW